MALKYDLTLIAVKVLDLGTGRHAAKRKTSFENERTVRPFRSRTVFGGCNLVWH